MIVLYRSVLRVGALSLCLATAACGGNSVVGCSGLASAPFALTTVQAQYPAIAIQQGATGTVVIRVFVSTTGSIASTTILQSSGNAALDGAALAAATQSTYAAGKDSCGRATTASIDETFQFRNG